MTPAQDMHMEMKHTLAAMGSGVNDDTVPGLGNPLQFRDLTANQQQPPEQLSIRIVQLRHRDDMCSGNDERMDRRLGVDIVECDHQIVLIDECGRNSPRDNFAKETVAHGAVSFLKPDFPNRVANS